ncbi:MAG: formylglycine-generating enzyme family protein [Bdellovibrio sp.]|nr:formylglycine-generating enzyme family protein [Bdellovibrio sp.]
MKHLKGIVIFGIVLFGVFHVVPCRAQDMVLVPAGSFQMPAFLDKTPRKVSEFFIDKHPVTNTQYLKFVTAHPEWRKSKAKKIFVDGNYLEYWKGDLDFGGPEMASSPVVRVSWYAARAYCDSLGKRLATIDEWEYVGQMAFKDKRELKSLILEWYGQGAEWPLPGVMKKTPNILDVYDMHGLIWEWVEDFNSSMVTGESRSDVALDRNLFCGGGAASAADPADYAAFMRYAFRSSLQAKYTVRNLGFRCVKNKE